MQSFGCDTNTRPKQYQSRWDIICHNLFWARLVVNNHHLCHVLVVFPPSRRNGLVGRLHGRAKQASGMQGKAEQSTADQIETKARSKQDQIKTNATLAQDQRNTKARPTQDQSKTKPGGTCIQTGRQTERHTAHTHTHTYTYILTIPPSLSRNPTKPLASSQPPHNPKSAQPTLKFETRSWIKRVERSNHSSRVAATIALRVWHNCHCRAPLSQCNGARNLWRWMPPSGTNSAAPAASRF